MNEIQRAILQSRQIRIEMTFPAPGMDNRYKCLVRLIRADRPRMWAFRCHNCQSKVVDLMNEEVIAIDDFFDPQNPMNHGVGKHCKGTQKDGLPCPYSYFFQLQ